MCAGAREWVCPSVVRPRLTSHSAAANFILFGRLSAAARSRTSLLLQRCIQSRNTSCCVSDGAIGWVLSASHTALAKSKVDKGPELTTVEHHQLFVLGETQFAYSIVIHLVKLHTKRTACLPLSHCSAVSYSMRFYLASTSRLHTYYKINRFLRPEKCHM